MPEVHDRGGWPGDEPIDQSDHQLMDWERQTHALSTALTSEGLKTTDEMRRAIESIPAEEYEALSYYERWSAAIERLLVERNVLTVEEIDERVRAIERRWS